LLAEAPVQAVSSPDFVVTIERIGGILPFRMIAERIEIARPRRQYLALQDFSIDISAAELVSDMPHIRSLSFTEIEMARSSSAPSTTPRTEYLRVAHLPVGLALDRLSIGRLALAAPVLCESLVATVEGSTFH
jgi:autotransporter translocation and assembly factor TamB